MQIQSIGPAQLKGAVAFSSVAEPLMRLIGVIREYILYIFTAIASWGSLSPFKYMFSLAGPKKMIAVTLSISLDRIAKMLPFTMWVPKVQFGITVKFKKVGAKVTCS